ncbi:hypothetical protein [Chryseobacterium koreense]
MKRKISRKEFKELDSDAKWVIIRQILHSEYADEPNSIILKVPRRVNNGISDEEAQMDALLKTLEAKIFSENTELEYDDEV